MKLNRRDKQASKQASSNMARALLVADPLFAATTDNDAPEARPGQTSDDTLTASEPHRARGLGLDLLRPHAEKTMLKQETGTEMLPAQPRSDASHATEQEQEQAALQLRDLGHAGQHTQHHTQQQLQQQLQLLTQLQEAGSVTAAEPAQPQYNAAHAAEQPQEQAAAQPRAPAHTSLPSTGNRSTWLETRQQRLGQLRLGRPRRRASARTRRASSSNSRKLRRARHSV